MAKKVKKSGRKTVTLARAKTEKTDVASPTVPNQTEYVDRVIDLLAQMFGRGDISQIQFAAGDRYRTSFETLSASAGGAGDFDRVRGAGVPDGLGISYVRAARSVSDARLKILYPRDYAVLHRVCVEGKTFEQVARDLSSSDLGVSFYRKEISYMFKSALSQLAAAWWPDKVPKIDQPTLDHLGEDDEEGEDKPRFVELGSTEWDRMQNYRALKGMPPLVPSQIKRGKAVVEGTWLRADNVPMTAEFSEKASIVDVETDVSKRKSPVAHTTRDKVFYSNREKAKT